MSMDTAGQEAQAQELEEARRSYAAEPGNRAHRERLAALNERNPVVEAEYAGLPCAQTLLASGKPLGTQGSLLLTADPGRPAIELTWYGVRFNPEDEQLGEGFFYPFGPGYFDALYVNSKDKADKALETISGYTLVRFSVEGQPLTLVSEIGMINRFWDDGSEAGDTKIVFQGPRLHCNGTWLVLAALCEMLPAWQEKRRVTSNCEISWGPGRQEGTLELRFSMQYFEAQTRMPCVQFQEYVFDLEDRSYSFRHDFAPTKARGD